MDTSITRRGAIYHARRTLSISLQKYGAVVRVSIANNLAYVMKVFFRALLLVVLVFILSQLWKTTFSAQNAKVLSGFTINDMV